MAIVTSDRRVTADLGLLGAAEEVADGRRRRRELGRRSVVDAMIDLVLESGTVPGADAVAARAGVSPASLFRYFATLDELRAAAITRYFQRFDAAMEIPRLGDGTLRSRIARFIAARDAFYSQTAPMARLVRRHAEQVEDLGVNLARVRATLADQIAHHFAAELSSFAAAARTQRVAVLAAITSFEAWEQLRPLGDGGRRAALRRALDDLLDV